MQDESRKNRDTTCSVLQVSFCLYCPSLPIANVPLPISQGMLHSSLDLEVSEVLGTLGECEYWNIQTTKTESIGIPGTWVFRWPRFIRSPRHGS